MLPGGLLRDGWSMESKAEWDAENRRTLEALRRRLFGIVARSAAAGECAPSPYGRVVDAVARKGFYAGQLAEFVGLQNQIEALKLRLSIGYSGALRR